MQFNHSVFKFENNLDFDSAFYTAYNNAWPMEAGWRERIDICNLYPLMVHVNLFGGGYLGLVVGGTFLGGFDIYERTGLEGYEIAAYVGAIIGAVVMIIVGVTIALGIAKSRHS